MVVCVVSERECVRIEPIGGRTGRVEREGWGRGEMDGTWTGALEGRVVDACVDSGLLPSRPVVRRSKSRL